MKKCNSCGNPDCWYRHTDRDFNRFWNCWIPKKFPNCSICVNEKTSSCFICLHSDLPGNTKDNFKRKEQDVEKRCGTIFVDR
jgi:hypothetical protein